MKSVNFTVIIRTAVILFGLALIVNSLFEMPKWFGDWFTGMVLVVVTMLMIARDEPEPKDKP